MCPRLALFVMVTASAICAADQSPNVTLEIHPPFSTSVSVKHYQKGEDVLISLPYRLTTIAPLTQYRGWFGDKNAEQDHNHGWKIAVYGVANHKVIAAYAGAKDGYQANLNECPEFLTGVILHTCSRDLSGNISTGAMLCLF